MVAAAAGAVPARAAEQKYYQVERLAASTNLTACRVGYRTFGTLNADQSNAVLFPTWLTGRSADLEQLIGPGKLIDSSRWFVIAVDAIGDGVSCSPSTRTSGPRLAFPEFGVETMVASQYALATRGLGLKHLRAVIGISMGGMQAFSWAKTHPEFIDGAIAIVGTPRPTAQDLLTWTAELRSLDTSANWRGGDYTGHPSFPALVAVHNLALSTGSKRREETSPAQFSAFFAKAQSDTFKTFEPADWYRQLQAMLSFDIVGTRSVEDAAREVRTPMLIVTSKQDRLVDPAPAAAFARSAGARLLELDSDCGHLAPICELPRVSAEVASFLDTLPDNHVR